MIEAADVLREALRLNPAARGRLGFTNQHGAHLSIGHSFRPTFTTTGASLPGLSLASNTFGQVRNSLDPQIMQFALKYVF